MLCYQCRLGNVQIVQILDFLSVLFPRLSPSIQNYLGFNYDNFEMSAFNLNVRCSKPLRSIIPELIRIWIFNLVYFLHVSSFMIPEDFFIDSLHLATTFGSTNSIAKWKITWVQLCLWFDGSFLFLYFLYFLKLWIT